MVVVVDQDPRGPRHNDSSLPNSTTDSLSSTTSTRTDTTMATTSMEMETAMIRAMADSTKI